MCIDQQLSRSILVAALSRVLQNRDYEPSLVCFVVKILCLLCIPWSRILFCD